MMKHNFLFEQLNPQKCDGRELVNAKLSCESVSVEMPGMEIESGGNVDWDSARNLRNKYLASLFL